ncbi:diguanylate cyclase [Paraglaciecola sp. 2405UD69-4]|uniref:diguanylate cyclase n=1 Tax=Paraglaciecola sp. 2405UD69-4 TaxID=3391836 RepID=UPI0039C93142
MTKKAIDVAIPVANPAKSMTITYVVSLSIIAILSIFVHFMLDKIIHEQSDSAVIVNISGQQRMLSQRVSLFTLEYLSTGHEESKAEALLALDKLNTNHALLTTQHLVSDDINNSYFSAPHNVDKQVNEFTTLVKQALNSNDGNTENYLPDVNLAFFEMAKSPLLESLDYVVHQYEHESIKKVAKLRLTQQVVSVIILLTVLVEALFIFRPMVNKVKDFADNLHKEANYDHLTGLLNRRSFEMLLDNTFELSKRNKYELSVLTFDIDHFKSINDTYGHDVGDKAIQHISDILQKNTRASDCTARFGGEEFVILLPQTEQQNAFLLANKLRKLIEDTPLTLNSLIIEITASAGVSGYQEGDNSSDDMLKRADEGLYKAKNAGRNLVFYG